MSRETCRLKPSRPHAAQQAVLDERKQFNLLCCGRRWGKTVIGIDRVIESAISKTPRKVAWFAPSYKLLGDAWRDLNRVLKPIIKNRDTRDHRLEFKTGGSLECWTLDKPDAGRSRSYHEVIVDEAAMVSNLESAWQKAIQPTLADYDGSAWFLSTPRGIASYFHTLFLRGQDPLNQYWRSWQMPTIANPFMKESVIERFREDVTDLVFAQEYQAQFVSWAGAVFRRIMDAVSHDVPGPTVMIGVDWGRTGDFTVFTALSAEGHVTKIDRFRGIEYSMQRDRLATFWKSLGGNSYVIAEMNSMGAPVVEQLQRDGLPVYGFTTTNQSKAAIIQALALAFERGVIKIPDDPVLCGELQAFESKKLAGGLIRYAAPEGLHDDMVLSLAFAWAGILMPSNQTMYLDPNTGLASSRFTAGNGGFIVQP